jgi:16S rRNA (guanine966-N2)-methyltransferase
VLDGFAGSGALGIEALSRGAAEAVFIEKDAEALKALRANLQRLGLGGRARVSPADILHPPKAQAPCGIVLLDPPYDSGLAAPALAALAAAGWLADRALVSVEMARQEHLTPPPGFTEIEDRHYGKARLVILLHVAGES